MMNLKGRNFITLKDFTPEEIGYLLDLAAKLKEEKKKDLTKIKQDFDKNIMPDLTGISLREFLSIYPQGKFSQYEVKGSGKVIGQFPEKGIKLDKQSKIQIVLE